MNKFYDLFETVNTDTNDSVSTCIDSFFISYKPNEVCNS